MFDLQYTYNSGSTTHDDNRDILEEKLTVGANVWDQKYTYDSLNRIASAAETYNSAPAPSWSRGFGYDRFGNMWTPPASAAGIGVNPATPQAVTAFDQATNRLAFPAVYDAAGNLTTDTQGNTYVYDAENKMTSCSVAGVASSYTYDGDGHRISKTVGGGTATIFVYNVSGQLIAEYGGPATNGGTSYLTTDHLGSTRVVTNGAGVAIGRHDYLPFGEEIAASIGSRQSVPGYSNTDDTRQKFTSKERDSESSLDFFDARYYSSPQGRFTGADGLLSSGTIYDPQSWNRYSYTLNDPLKYTDPFGLYVFDASATDAEKKSFRKGLETLRRARDHYRAGSDNYNRINRALSAYGSEGVDNGVKVKFGATSDGTPAETKPGINADASGNKVTTADNPTGQQTTVTIDATKNSDSFAWATSIGHEGSHVADIAAAVGSLPVNLGDPKATAALSGPFSLNVVKWWTEWKAYTTESNIAQALEPNGIVSIGGDTKFEIWNGGWAAADVDKKRASGIFNVMIQPQSQHGVYHLNPFVGDFGKRLLD